MSASDKGPLAVIITGSTVAAFAASNLYVFGLSIALHHDLAIHFEVLDWVRITPAWALPAFLFYGSMTGLFLLWGILQERLSPPGRSGPLRRFFPSKGSIGYLLLVGEIFLALSIAWDIVQYYAERNRSFPRTTALYATVLISLVITSAVDWALKRATANQQSFLRTILGEKYIGASVVWVGVLSFAFFYGLLVAPSTIRNGPPTRVVLAEEKPSPEGAIDKPGQKQIPQSTPKEIEVEGKLIFRLSHSVLLLIKRSGSPLVVIPEEKIKRIESLNNKWRSAPKPTA